MKVCPTKSGMITLARDCGGRRYIEPKDADPLAVLETVGADFLEHCFFGSENPDAMRELRRLSKDATLMARRCDFASLEAAFEDCRSQIIEFDAIFDDLAEVAACADLPARSMIYSQSHDMADMIRLTEIGPDYVNLDRPDLFVEAMRRRDRSAGEGAGS